MKKLIIAVIAFGPFGYASAQASEHKVAQTAVATAADQEKKTPVKLEDLPEAVKKTLAGDSYAGWQAASAMWVDGKMPHYEIVMTRGEEKNTVRLSKQGQPIA